MTDITSKVSIGSIDGNKLSVARCVCGARFDFWDYVIGAHAESAKPCPACGRRLYFTVVLKIYEVA